MTFKLFKEQKEEGLFIKTCVVECSTDEEPLEDCRGQSYTSDEIAILLSTEANNCYFDYNHNLEKLDGIYTLQNYQSKVEEYIANVKIPVGSWIKIVFSENSFINNKIHNGEVKGVSNDFTINTTKNYCKKNKELPPGVNTFLYEDVEEKECIVQNILSFVDSPCNRMPIETYTYEEYKLNNGDDAMSKLTDQIKKIFNKKDENPKKYDIKNEEDVIRIINEISEEKIATFKEEMGVLVELINEDIEFIKGDLETAKTSISKVLDEEGDDEEGESEEPEGNEGDIQNKDKDPEKDSKDDKLTEILNRLDKIEGTVEEAKKKPLIKNQNFIKNLKKKEGVKTLFNRGK